ncbi:MAG: DUF2088 domain-containing protein [Verrucomicrobia bacterium]|nr:MAG: DUF2088 domain-containing protein [Verrucomicrobiota bacterium]
METVLAQVPLPRMVRVRQRFPGRTAPWDPAPFARDLRARAERGDLGPGKSIAIAVGSRGIENLEPIVRMVAQTVRAAGSEPFLVPAMGSHGNATAEGQASVLRSLGLGKLEAEGVPIRSSMETVLLGESASGVPVYTDATALAADGVIVVNRVKPHTSFRGDHESGLLKMLVIGLGKQKGAELCHRLGFGTMARNLREMSAVVLAHQKVLFGVAILENAHHNTERIEIVEPDAFPTREAELLKEARSLLPRIYPNPIDVLVLDEIGKDISGTGFDPNLVGRFHNPHAWDIGGIAPEITRMVALGLTPGSHGNANGLGNLDVVSRRLVDAMDPETTYINALTSSIPVSVKIPMTQANDRLAIQAAIKMAQIEDWTQVRLVRIRNTLTLGEIEVSENILADFADRDELEPLGPARPFAFDPSGHLAPLDPVH